MAFAFTTNPNAYQRLNNPWLCRGFIDGRPAPRRKRTTLPPPPAICTFSPALTAKYFGKRR